MVEVVFLGLGASIPMRGQTNSSFLVRTGGIVLLIDCGPAVLQQLDLVGLTPGDVTHVFVTHRHGDHCLGYPLFLLWWISNGQGRGSWPTTIASETTWSSLLVLGQNSFRDALDSVNAAPRVTLSTTEPASVPLSEQFLLRTWPMMHSDFAPDLGVRLEIGGTVLAFTGDTTACPNLEFLARDADLLVHDATYSAILSPEHAEGAHGHATAQMAGRHAAAAGVKHLVLTHIAHRYQGQQGTLIDEAAREFDGLVSVPEAGEVFTFDTQTSEVSKTKEV